MIVFITPQYNRSVYLRTDSQLFRSWYNDTTRDTPTNIRIISYSQCNILFNQKDNIV